MGLFIKKPFEALLAEANASGSKSLKRVLGPWSLVALGVGVIIGAGLFSITGTVAAGYTGPAITLSFAIAALGCCFAGLCYAEFASMIPVAGSAYTYSYATMGELIAWIIGWDLVLEYTVAATTVRYTWRIRSLGCPAWSRHRFLCFPGIRCRQYGCTGNKKSETEYADRYPGITLGMYRTLYAVCPRNDRSSPLYRI